MTTAAVMYAVAAPSVAAAQAARPNYSGTWVLDSSKSQMTSAMQDNLPQLAAGTWIIAQHGDTLIMDRDMTMSGAHQKSHIVVAIDGKSWKNTVPTMGGGDIETSTIASWENGELVVRSSGNVQGSDFVQTDRWTLSADGKVFVSHRSVTVPGAGEVQASTLTFTKQM
jgi:hypothetical protein